MCVTPSRIFLKKLLRVGLALTCSFVFFAATPASAAFRYMLPDLSVNAGDSGQISVALEVTDPNIGTPISGYNIQFSVAAGVTLTGPSIPDAGGTYDLGNYTDGTFGQTINGANFMDVGSVATIGSDDLAYVPFEIDAGTPVGTVFPLEWTGLIFNELNPPAGGTVDLSLVDGSITVVPEPSSMALGLLASSLLLGLRRRR